MSAPRAAIACLLGALALAMGGCAADLPSPLEVVGLGGEAPSFTLDRVVLDETSEDADKLDFILTGANPTKNPYPLREVNYTVRIDGRVVFRGVRSAQTTLPPNDSHDFRVPAPIPRGEAGPLAGRQVRYEIFGAVAYLPPGPIAEILYDLGVQRRTVRFRDEGVLETPAAEQPPAP